MYWCTDAPGPAARTCPKRSELEMALDSARRLRSCDGAATCRSTGRGWRRKRIEDINKRTTREGRERERERERRGIVSIHGGTVSGFSHTKPKKREEKAREPEQKTFVSQEGHTRHPLFRCLSPTPTRFSRVVHMCLQRSARVRLTVVYTVGRS